MEAPFNLIDTMIMPRFKGIHGPIIIAQERGYFSDVGLEVEIVAPADPSAPPKLVAAGDYQIWSPGRTIWW